MTRTNHTARTLIISALFASINCSPVMMLDAIAKSEKAPKHTNEIAIKEPSVKSAAELLKEESESLVTLKEMTTAEALMKWMTYYYLHPQPELLVAATLVADKKGLLKGGAAPPFQAFISRVMAQNPEKLRDWYQQLTPLSDDGKTLLLTSIWWANTKEGKEVLDAIASTLPEKPKAEFKKQIENPAVEIDKMEIDSPAVLDMLWGCFCATGDEKYVKRLATTLNWQNKDSKDMSKMLIVSGARWSLVSNINQHEKVKTIVESFKSDPDLKALADPLIAEAAKKLAEADAAAKLAAEKAAKEKADKAVSDAVYGRTSDDGNTSITESSSSEKKKERKAKAREKKDELKSAETSSAVPSKEMNSAAASKETNGAAAVTDTSAASSATPTAPATSDKTVSKDDSSSPSTTSDARAGSENQMAGSGTQSK